jgi:outer membrane protein assembly factor BamD
MRHSLALILLLSLIACSSSHSLVEGDLDTTPRSAADIYADAEKAMNQNDYIIAVQKLESLVSRYPYGVYAQQGQMELAYAYYKQSDTDSALSAADRFLKNYPTSPHADYIYYLKGVINFNADMGLFANLFPHDLSQHDPDHVKASFDAFKELVTRYPNSKYVPDARVRMQFLVNSLARHEINIAQYYLRRHAYVAAANRAKDVLTDYPRSPQTRDALQVMVQAYNAMGMNKLRDDAQRVLDLNSKSTITPASTPAPSAQTTPPAAAPTAKP